MIWYTSQVTQHKCFQQRKIFWLLQSPSYFVAPITLIHECFIFRKASKRICFNLMHRLRGNAVSLALCIVSVTLFHPVPSSKGTSLANEITTLFLSWTDVSSTDYVFIVGEHT